MKARGGGGPSSPAQASRRCPSVSRTVPVASSRTPYDGGRTESSTDTTDAGWRRPSRSMYSTLQQRQQHARAERVSTFPTVCSPARAWLLEHAPISLSVDGAGLYCTGGRRLRPNLLLAVAVPIRDQAPGRRPALAASLPSRAACRGVNKRGVYALSPCEAPVRSCCIAFMPSVLEGHQTH